MAGVRTSWGSGPSLHLSSVEFQATDATSQNDVGQHTDSASNIEIGSLRSSSSVNSEELHRFYNETWNVGPFMAGGL